MHNPSLPASLRPVAEPKISKRHPRAEWSLEERRAWEVGMLDAAAIAQALGDTALVEKIAQAIETGPY